MSRIWGAEAVQDVAPVTVDRVPAGQLVQVLADVAPVTPEYVPAGQLVHAAAVPPSEYVPAAQLTQLRVAAFA